MRLNRLSGIDDRQSAIPPTTIRHEDTIQPECEPPERGPGQHCRRHHRSRHCHRCRHYHRPGASLSSVFPCNFLNARSYQVTTSVNTALINVARKIVESLANARIRPPTHKPNIARKNSGIQPTPCFQRSPKIGEMAKQRMPAKQKAIPTSVNMEAAPGKLEIRAAYTKAGAATNRAPPISASLRGSCSSFIFAQRMAGANVLRFTARSIPASSARRPRAPRRNGP
jgi:hypothetical protein